MVVDNPYYSADVHGPYELADIGDLVLEEGDTLRGCQLAYQTLGRLNAAKDNAVLVTTWYSGNHGIMRDTYVGPGRALDPDEWFVVLVNQIGSGLGTSPHNLVGPYGQGCFPHVRIGDDVGAQERLLREHLGVEELALVFGGSMGAQQTYEWAVRFPDRVKRAAPLAGTARSVQHCINWAQTLVETLEGDPGWNGGFYRAPEDVRAGLRGGPRPLARSIRRGMHGGAPHRNARPSRKHTRLAGACVAGARWQRKTTELLLSLRSQ